VDAVRVPIGPDNPRGNSFTHRATRLRRESEAARLADASVDRTWHIVSTERTNRVGEPTGHLIRSTEAPTLLADPASSIAARAAFTTKHLWVTRYAREERYPAGDFVNQHHGGAGLPAFAAQDRDIDGQDIVVWHTFGPTHFPRLEDWPIMPVDRAGFQLRPYGFFDRNPSVNVPAPDAHCAPGGEHESHDHGHHGRGD
jgi:primary-amine oxidase